MTKYGAVLKVPKTLQALTACSHSGFNSFSVQLVPNILTNQRKSQEHTCLRKINTCYRKKTSTCDMLVLDNQDSLACARSRFIVLW